MKAALLALVTALMLHGIASAANPLTRAEKRVCQTLPQCVSIVQRHPHDSYDYNILNVEFARYGRRGQAELLRLLDRDPDARANAADLLALSQSPTLLAQLSIMASSSDPELAALTRNTIRAVAARLPTDAKLPPQSLLGLIVTAEEQPTLAVLRQLLKFPVQDIQTSLPSQIRSEDPEIALTAYNALYAHDPAQALNALRQSLKDTRQLTSAIAMGSLLAALDTQNPRGGYGLILSESSNNPSLSAAMRSGATYGLLVLSWSDAPRPLGPALTDRMIAIDSVLRTQGQSLSLRRVDATSRKRFMTLTGVDRLSAHTTGESCTLGQPLDPAARVGRLPFFETGVTLEHQRPSAKFSLPAYSQAERGLLRSALSLAGGWLAGYGKDQTGSLIWYANADSKPTVLIGGYTAAIFPKVAHQMGRLPLSAWAVSTLPNGTIELLSIEIAKPGAEPVIQRHAVLPSEPDRYARLPDNSLLIHFDGHAPVQVSPNGTVRQGCTAGSQQSSKTTPSLAGGQSEDNK